MKYSKENIEELRQKICYYNQLYYLENVSEISDAEYDQLFQQLIQIEKEFPELIHPESPTQRVGVYPQSTFEKIVHDSPMLSLSNIFNEGDLKEWHQKNREKLGKDWNEEYICEMKYDGVSINLKYETYQFVRGLTRGDGKIGEDVSSNVRAISQIPLILEEDYPPFEVRGEIIMSHPSFIRCNEIRQKKGKEEFSNPRNAASGSLRQHDPREVWERGLSAVFYHVPDFGEEWDKQQYVLESLKQWGFPIGPYTICQGVDEVIGIYNTIMMSRNELSYDIDGMVIKVNDLVCQQKLGHDSRTPRWATAWKFPAEQKCTQVLDIRLQIGRMGSVTPVADVEPIEVGGVIVSHCTLHNEDFIIEKDVRIGDYVFIERSGDVIPYLSHVDISQRDEKSESYEYPLNCPDCDSLLVKDGSRWYCQNDLCGERAIARFTHFGSRDAMDIRNFGEKAVRKIYETGYLSHFSNIYELEKYHDVLVNIEGFGEKSLFKLYDEIEQSQKQSLDRLIYSLGIPYCGRTVSKEITKNITTFKEFREITYNDLIHLPGVGEKIASSILSYLREYSEELDRLLPYVKEIHSHEYEHDEDSRLSGKIFCITGKLEHYSRSELKSRIEESGGKVTSSLSKNVDFLVVGENPGSKFEKATHLGVKIITETVMLNFL